MEENTLHFSITVDGSGLKDIQSQSQAAFKGIAKGVEELSSKSVDELQDISLELMEVIDRFKKLADAVGVEPKFLRQTLNHLREIRAEQEKMENAQRSRQERLQNAEAKLIRQQIANLEAERRAREKNTQAEIAAEQKLAKIKAENIRYAGKLRHDGHTEFINEINAQNRKIKEQGDKAVAEFEKVLGVKNKSFGSGFTGGIGNALSGKNNGTFANALGAFGGGGRFGGFIANGLDGAIAGAGEGAGAGAIAGGLVGGAAIGAAIIAVTTLISLLKAGATALYEFGKAGVQSAADFEQTVNSIAVFAGGVQNAKKELALLEETVSNTTGLSLEGAEAGYKQLRALGFEAANSRKLIEGLGKIRITSGATEQSVERVIVNLTQLSASTARAGQDIREIVHALPAMRQVFRETFGTAEASKLKALIEQDGDAFFEKLAEGMSKFQGASGGMNDALIKLQNQWTLVWREFGKPIVPVLTDAFRELAEWLKTNKNEFAAWGMVVADVFRSILKALPYVIDGFGYLARGLAAVQTFGLSEVFLDFDSRVGLSASKNKYLEQLQANEKNSASASLGISDADSDRAAEKAEQARKKQLDNIKAWSELKNQIIADSYRIEEARVEAHHTWTVEEELDKNRVLYEIRRQSMIAQRNEQIRSIDEQIKLQAGNDDEIRDLLVKRSEVSQKYATEIKLNEIRLMKETQEAERKIQEQRRAAEIEFRNFQAEEAKFGFDKVTAEVSRGLQRQVLDTGIAYATLKSATEKYFADVLRIQKERTALQFQDKSLTDAQRQNLQNKANLEERSLAEQQKQAILKIQDDQFAAEEAKRDRNLQRIKEYYSALGEMIQGAVSSLFNPETIVSSSLELFQKLFLKLDERNKLKEEIKSRQDNIRDFTAELGGEKASTVTPEFAKEFIQNRQTMIKAFTKELEDLEKSLNPVYVEIDRLGKLIVGQVGNFKEFDQIAKLALRERQELEVKSLNAEIENAQKRLNQSKKDYQDNHLQQIKEFQTKIDALEKDESIPKSVKPLYKKPYEDIIAIHQSFLDLSKTDGFIPPTDKAIELNGQIEQLGLTLGNLRLNQRSEEAERYANSLEGLAERLAKLNSGNAGAVNGVLDRVGKDVLRERIALAEENIELEARFATVGDDSANRYRNAWLRAIYDVKNASEEAKVSQITSQVQIADQTVFNAEKARAGILEAMAGAKGYTEIFQDAFLSVNEKIGSGLESLIKKATEGLGVFGDVLADIAGQLLRMVTNRLMMKLLDMLIPPTVGVGSASGGGLNLGSIFQGALGILTGGAGRGANNSAVGAGAINSNAIAALGAVAGLNVGALSNSSVSGNINWNNVIASAAGRDGSSLTDWDLLGKSWKLGDSPQPTVPTDYAALRSGANTAGGSFLNTLLGGNFSLSNLGKSFGAAAPLLGLSLGSGLGGQSGIGQILGGVGGLAGGIALGIGTGAIGTGATAGFSILGGVLSATAATGILAAAAVPLLVGAYILGRNKLRRQEEKVRTQHINDALSQLDEILKKTRSHDISGDEAIRAAESVRDQYRENVSQLKDGKTRRIALNEIPSRIEPKLNEIRAAAKLADEDRLRFEDRLPEFATGGIVPGRFGEPRLVLAHGGEIIANPSQQTPAFIAAAAEAGIPGVRGGSGGYGGGGQPVQLNVEFVIGTDAQNQLFVNGAKSTKGYNVSIEQQGKARRFRDANF